jgi:HEAT repeat protein
MVSFCSSCWREIDARAAICPACGADLALEDARPFVEKVRRALFHPEPETATRAAWILGELRERAAVPELMRILETTQDGYRAEAAAESLGKIGDASALPALERAAECGSLRTQLAAREALERIRGGGEGRGSMRPSEAGSAGARGGGPR